VFTHLILPTRLAGMTRRIAASHSAMISGCVARRDPQPEDMPGRGADRPVTEVLPQQVCVRRLVNLSGQIA